MRVAGAVAVRISQQRLTTLRLYDFVGNKKRDDREASERRRRRRRAESREHERAQTVKRTRTHDHTSAGHSARGSVNNNGLHNCARGCVCGERTGRGQATRCASESRTRDWRRGLNAPTTTTTTTRPTDGRNSTNSHGATNARLVCRVCAPRWMGDGV